MDIKQHKLNAEFIENLRKILEGKLISKKDRGFEEEALRYLNELKNALDIILSRDYPPKSIDKLGIYYNKK